MSSSTSELDGVQKAAILLITLGPEKAAGIFKHLKEDEIEQLTLEIANTRSVTPAEKELLTDAAKIFVMKGEKVHIVDGEVFNIKITYPYDLRVAEALLKGNEEIC